MKSTCRSAKVHWVPGASRQVVTYITEWKYDAKVDHEGSHGEGIGGFNPEGQGGQGMSSQESRRQLMAYLAIAMSRLHFKRLFHPRKQLKVHMTVMHHMWPEEASSIHMHGNVCFRCLAPFV